MDQGTGWMDGWMNGWMDGCMDGWMQSIDGSTHAQLQLHPHPVRRALPLPANRRVPAPPAPGSSLDGARLKAVVASFCRPSARGCLPVCSEPLAVGIRVPTAPRASSLFAQ